MSEMIRDDGPIRELGPYSILEKIGEGGMGSVYLAVDQRSSRKVAVKVLSSSQDGARRRFRREAEAVLSLDHPNLVRGIEAGEDQGCSFYVMEYCDGESLDRRMRREGRLPWRESLALLVPVIAALRYAHDRGIIHRDIKPSNILAGRDGTVKVLDFGLSKSLVNLDEPYPTQTGLTVGTPHYMAPEQARGAKDIDGRADLYSLGATLYHLMTGRTPFPGSSPIEVIAKHVHAPLPDPRSICPEIPESVVHIVRRMMAQQPDDRYRDGAQLSADVEAVLAGKPPLSPPMVEKPREVGAARSRSLASSSASPYRTRLWVSFAVVLVLAVSLTAYRMKPQRAAGASLPGSPTAASTPEESPFYSFESWKADVNLLEKVDPRRDAFVGSWRFDKGDLISDRLAGCRLQIPYEPPEEYDYLVEFTRLEGQDEIVQICSRSGSSFAWRMDNWKDRSFGFSAKVDDPALAPLQSRSRDPFLNGRRNVSVVRVRKDGCEAFVNGWSVGTWKTDFARPGACPVWNLASNRTLGLGAQDSVVAFHRVELREVSGRGRSYDPPHCTLNFSPLSGGKGGSRFEEVIGLPLAGLRYSVIPFDRAPMVCYAQALYRRPDGSLKSGEARGNAMGQIQELVAKPGYAVGALTVVGDIRLRGFKAKMMRLKGSPPALDPSDSYVEDWRGQQGGLGEVVLDSGREPMIGIHGKSGAHIDALGLVWLRSQVPSNQGKSDPQSARQASPSGLLGRWDFDEDRDRRVQDSSGWGQDGFVLGPPKWSLGKTGRALELAGPEAGVVVPTIGLDSGSVGVSCWVRSAKRSGKPQRYVSTQNDAFILGCDASGFLTFSVTFDGRPETVLAKDPTPPEAWHHAAGTWDGRTLIVYKDGREAGRKDAAGAPLRDRGCRFGDDLEPLIGLMDDVRIYERALPPEEIRRIAEDIPERLGLREPERPGALVQGVLREFYPGPIAQLPELSTKSPALQEVAERPDLSSVRGLAAGFGLRFSGFLEAPVDGFYTFTHAGYDSSRLLIGSTEVLSAPGARLGLDKRGSIALKAGKHPFTVEYLQNGWTPQFYMLWEADGLQRQEIPPQAYGVSPTSPGASRVRTARDLPPLLAKEGWSLDPGAGPGPGSLVMLYAWDAQTEATERAGKSCARLKENQVSDQRYLCVALRASWDPSWQPAEVAVEYLDEGGGSFGLEYDGSLREFQAAPSMIQILDSGQWKSARFVLPDAAFRGRQVNGGDFRLCRGNADLWIHRITVKAGRSRGPVDPAPLQQQAASTVDPEGFITDWLVLGPVSLEKEIAILDEAGQRLTFERRWLADLKNLQPREGDKTTVAGAALNWMRAHSSNGRLSFSGERSLFLAAAYVDPPHDRSDLTLSIGSDDGSIWWLNGSEVLRVSAARGLARDQNPSPQRVRLRKGGNVLLAGVLNLAGPAGACARFLDPSGKPVTDLRLQAGPPPPSDFSGTWINSSMICALSQQGERVSGTSYYGVPTPIEGKVLGRSLKIHFGGAAGSGYEASLDLAEDGRSADGTWGAESAPYRSPWSLQRFDPLPLEFSPALIRGMKHPDLELRRKATLQLAWRSDESKDVVTAFPDALRDQDPVMMTNAGNYIARIGPSLIPELRAGLGDEEPAVRAAAARLLARFGERGQDAVPALTERLKDPEPRVRAAAAGALSVMGSAAAPALPALDESLKDPDPRVRQIAAFTLGQLRGDSKAAAAPLETVRVEPGKGYWPQWRGPKRDNVSRETGLLKEWPEAGPPLAWELKGIGTGIAAVALGGGRIYALGYIGESEMLSALDERSGKLVWSSRVGPALAEQSLMRWLGQRMPTLDEDRIYAVQAQGQLVCFNTATGKEIWRRDYVRDFGTQMSGWKLCDRPLVDGDRLIVTGSSVTALNKRTGQFLWKSEPLGTSAHAATVVLETAGLRQYVAFVQGRMVGVDSRNGKILWTHEPFGQTANSCSPMVVRNSILAAAGYNVGLAYVNLVPTYDGVFAHAQYTARLQISPFQDSAVISGDHAYFVGSAGTLCVEVATGKTVWGPERSTGPGNSSMTFADGLLYTLSPNGLVTLIEANPEKFVPKSKFQFPEFEKGAGATNPVIAGGRLYLRHDSRLLCYDIGERALQVERPKTEPRVLEIPSTGVAPTGTPFVTTPPDVVDRMLDLAGVKKEDLVFDLGSGDGRIVIAAARKFGAKATGFEIEEDLVRLSRKKIEEAELGKLAAIEQKDLFQVDLSPATVIAVYLPEKFLERLLPQFEKLKPGTRIVSHQFRIPGVEPERTAMLESAEDGATHAVYLWTAPLRKSEK